MNRRDLIATLASAAGLLAASSLGAAAASGQRARALRQGPRQGQGVRLLCQALRRGAPEVASEAERRRHDALREQLCRCRMGRQYTLQIGVHFRTRPALFQLEGGCGAATRRERRPELRHRLRRRRDRRPRQGRRIPSWCRSPTGRRPGIRIRSDEPPEDAKFGLDDKLFRLDRAKLQDCLPVVSDDEIKAEISATQ